MIYKVKKVNHPHDIKACVPGSKSITNRALLIAALSTGRSVLKGCLFSDDSRHFIEALIELGFPVAVDENRKQIEITGFGGKIPKSNASINVGSAGTAARFLTALLGLSKGRYRITSSEQMKRRPMKDLLLSLEQMGAVIEYEQEKYHFPFTIGNSGDYGDSVSINVDKSSQFLSALLISSVVMNKTFRINVTGSHGMAYVEMTIQMMKQFGVHLVPDKSNSNYIISEGLRYSAMEYAIEPDLSAACYFYAMSPLLNVRSQVVGVHSDSLQGDIAFLNVLKDMGCSLSEEQDGIVCRPPENGKISGGKWNLSSFSDQALTLAAIAPFADDIVEIDGISHIKLQECDRINAIIVNLQLMGVKAEETESGVIIYPADKVLIDGKNKFDIKDCEILTFEDHRVAMSFTLPGIVCDGISITDPYCCRKTFENYYDVLEDSVYGSRAD